MKRMCSGKKHIGLHGRIVAGGKQYSGTIEYVSPNRVEDTIISSIKDSHKFTPGKIIQLEFSSPSGSNMHLTCDVIWFFRPESEDNTLILGMNVLAPPMHYIEFIDSLNDREVCCSHLRA